VPIWMWIIIAAGGSWLFWRFVKGMWDQLHEPLEPGEPPVWAPRPAPTPAEWPEPPHISCPQCYEEMVLALIAAKDGKPINYAFLCLECGEIVAVTPKLEPAFPEPIKEQSAS
jgi:hypothetical protein